MENVRSALEIMGMGMTGIFAAMLFIMAVACLLKLLDRHM